MQLYNLHSHTVYSLNDGTITAKDARQFCDANDVAAFALTDHGHTMAHDAFREAFAGSNTKLIYGVEAYVLPRISTIDIEQTEDIDAMSEEDGKTSHLVLLAKDEIGLKAIYRMVTASYENMIKEKPVMTQELLNQYCAPGTLGHGHVIALSACMGGVLATIALYNETLERNAVKIENRASRLDIDIDHYGVLVATANEKQEELDALKDRRAELSALKAKKFTKRERDVAKLEGTPGYAQARAELDADIAKTEQAIIDYPLVKEQESVLSKNLTAIKGEIRKLDAKVSKYQNYLDQAESIRNSKLDDDVIYDNVLEAANYYVGIFGAENFYAELQYHGVPEEAICFPLIAQVAEELEIPVVATNDSHILVKSDQNRRTRQILRSLRFNRWADELAGDEELYIKSNDEMRTALLQILPAYIVDKAIANTKVIADQCNVEFQSEEHYPKFKSDIEGETALDALKRLCNESFKEYRKTLTPQQRKEYIERIRYEVDVIDKLNVADYLLIVQDFLEYGRLLGKIDLNDPRFLADPYNLDLIKKLGEGNVGMSIGLGRGSAVGSLVCFLLGITNADPIKYNLLFERFLNTERVTMPDIDSDFAPDVRGKVLDYVKHKYGEAAVCCISTIGTQAVKGSIRNCARLLGDRKYSNPKALINLGAEICASVPSEVGVKFSDCIDALRTKFSNNPDAMEILDDAVLVEGTFTQVGMHAAGVIIADNGDVAEYVPLMKSKDGLWVSQCDMNYTESRGLLKMDVRLVR